MSKHEQKHCPRCKLVFECKPSNIMQCQCSTIQLPENVIAFIDKEYNDCLCVECLQHLKQELSIKEYNS